MDSTLNTQLHYDVTLFDATKQLNSEVMYYVQRASCVYPMTSSRRTSGMGIIVSLVGGETQCDCHITVSMIG
jgi:hypothetical protein